MCILRRGSQNKMKGNMAENEAKRAHSRYAGFTLHSRIATSCEFKLNFRCAGFFRLVFQVLHRLYLRLIHQPAEILHLMFLYHRTSVNLRTTQNLSTDHKLTDSPKILHPKHFSFRMLRWILLSCTFIHQQSSSNWKGEEALYTRVCWKWRNCIVHTWGRTYHIPA